MRKAIWTIALAFALALAATGCATKKYVHEETAAVGARVDTVQGQVEQAQNRLNEHDRQISANAQATQAAAQNAQEASKTAQEALQRAVDAGKLAEGRLLSETVLTDDKVKFGFNAAKLSKTAQEALDQFAEQLKSQNQGVYIEIQGHTDNVGSTKYNEQLGLQRAEAVRRYLNQQQKFPLHRINVISYGKTSPIADNKTREGRSQNRRVALIVLK
jgi:peptidoglycan-associated lipoprotein